MRIITAPTRRISPAALPPMIKSLNYLNNIMAKMEAQQHGFHECLMLNEQGYVSECTGDNVFLIHKGRLITPASHAGALVGITRQVALEVAAALGIPTVETNITRYDVWNADECFLTGTAAEVHPGHRSRRARSAPESPAPSPPASSPSSARRLRAKAR
jgi:branched-chain amino acid aminotransferase